MLQSFQPISLLRLVRWVWLFLAYSIITGHSASISTLNDETCVSLTMLKDGEEIFPPWNFNNSQNGHPVVCHDSEDCQISYIELYLSVVKICKNILEDPEDTTIACLEFENSGSVEGHPDLDTRVINYIRCDFEKSECSPESCDAEDGEDWDDNECARLYNNNDCNKCRFESYPIKFGETKCLDRVENWSLRIRNSSVQVYGAFQNNSDPNDPFYPLYPGEIVTRYDRFSCCLGDACDREEEHAVCGPSDCSGLTSVPTTFTKM